ncbi:MAG TPA: hypothetical protein VMV10_06730 [Pirellulales bacterium]|nr:hypothetical protein [Pirellulales bacterium]
MLKRNDPAFDELVADLQSVASSQYREDPFHRSPVHFMKSETGLTFEQLNRGDQLYVLDASVSWEHYKNQGLSNAQAGVIFSNVRDGKPQDKWLDGVFDEAVLERHKVAGLKARVEDRRNSPDNYFFSEIDGSHNTWTNLSAAGKLEYIALDAASLDVPFKAFAEVARDVIGDNKDAALRVLFENQKELHALGELLPDDGRIEPTPLVERFKEILDHLSDLRMYEKERQESRNTLLQGIGEVLDGKPPARLLEGVKALHDILHGDHPKQQEVRTQERGGREI